MNGLVIGLVKDNVDGERMHRVLVEYPVEPGGKVRSAWCRVATSPGLAMLPDIGTEVALLVSERSASPYVVGALHNGVDALPSSDVHVIVSRSGHVAMCNDEGISLGAGAKALDVTSATVWHTFAEDTVTQHSEGATTAEAGRTISIRCKTFELDAADVILDGRRYAQRSSSATIVAGKTNAYAAARIDLNPSARPAPPAKALPFPSHRHPPKR